jgi:thymidine kinase
MYQLQQGGHIVGVFELNTGPMKAGKSKKLISLVNKMKKKKNVAVFTLTHSFTDEHIVTVTSRSEEVGDIVAFNMLAKGSYEELGFYIHQVTERNDITTIALIDEVHFATEELLQLYKEMHEQHGIDVIFFAISEDYKQQVFPSIQWLLDNGVKVKELTAFCDYCGETATKNIRLTNDDELFVEDKDIYKTVCVKCLDKRK